MPKPARVITTLDLTKKVFGGLRELANVRTMVGIPAESAGREDAADEGRERLNNAEIGYIQENGAPEANIPARPHLVPGVRASHETTVARFRDAAIAAMDGRKEVVEKNFHAAGVAAANSVKQVITKVIPPPLADSTLHRRKTRKVAPRQGETPLLDTGNYRRGVTHVLRSR